MCAVPGKCDLSVSYSTVSTVFHYLIEYFCFSTGSYDEVMPKTCLLRYDGCFSITFYIFFLRLESISVPTHSFSPYVACINAIELALLPFRKCLKRCKGPSAILYSNQRAQPNSTQDAAYSM